MAKIPTDNEVNEIVAQAEREELEKIESQKKQGKDFVNNGQGVIPEEVWKNLPGKEEK